MTTLSSTTFRCFGFVSLLVNLSIIRLLSILSYYARGVLLQAIEGFLPPAYARFLIINLKLLGLFQTCGPATWGEWSPCKIFFRYISDMYYHALFWIQASLSPSDSQTSRAMCQWTWSPVDFLQLDTNLNSKTSLKILFSNTYLSINECLPETFDFLCWNGHQVLLAIRY